MGCNCRGGRGTPGGATQVQGYNFIPPVQRTTDPNTGEVVEVQPATMGPYGTIYEARIQQRNHGGGQIKIIKAGERAA